MKSSERLLQYAILGLSSFFSLSVSANVDVPISVTYIANISLSTSPPAIDFGMIVPQGDVLLKQLDIIIVASHASAAFISMEAGNRVDQETSTIGGARFRVKLDPQLGWGTYFKIDNSPQHLNVHRGTTTLKAEIELNTLQDGSITEGAFTSNLRIAVRLV